MTKKAIITISLVPEAENKSNEFIKAEIMKATSENSIPLCAHIENVEIEEPEAGMIRKLREHGFSKNAASSIVMFYRG